MGGVNLTDRFLKSDPPTNDELDALNASLEEAFKGQLTLPTDYIQNPSALVGVGGTLVNPASVKLGLTYHNPERIHGEILTRQEVAD